MLEAIHSAHKTWNRETDGVPLMDYSSQQEGARKGKHADSVLLSHFFEYLKLLDGLESDIMFEIKDKEKSVEKALHVMKNASASKVKPE